MRRATGHACALALILQALATPALAYTFWSTSASYLGAGELHGPGKQSSSGRPLYCMVMRHLMFVTANDLVVPFENNGPAVPNIIGEREVPGDVDGRLSDGSLINENVNTCAMVITGRRVLPAVIQGGGLTGRVLWATSADGVITVSMDVAIDLSDGHVVKLPLYGTTGETVVPQSLQTQAGGTGVDQAGDYPSGTRVHGSVGDFNHDGWIDGTLVFAGVIPLDSPISPGEPFVMVRHFETDIPIDGEWSGDVKGLRETPHPAPRETPSRALRETPRAQSVGSAPDPAK